MHTAAWCLCARSAMIMMAVLAFGGWMLYDNKDLIVGTYKEHQKLPDIVEDRVEDAVAHLFKTTGATTVAVFKVNPLLGTRVQYLLYWSHLVLK